jgi:hypothetical protein
MQPLLQVHPGFIILVYVSSNHALISPIIAKYKLLHLYNCEEKDTSDLASQIQIWNNLITFKFKIGCKNIIITEFRTSMYFYP